MPNWCSNQVNLYHSNEKVVSEFEEMLKSSETLFAMIYPRPQNINEDDVVEWDCNNWGTKGEPIDISFEKQSSYEITVNFDTPWSPPVGVYKALINQGWKLTALYYESGYEYCGRFTNEAGDECYEYDSSDPCTIKNLPEDILEFSGLLDDMSDEDSECDDE